MKRLSPEAWDADDPFCYLASPTEEGEAIRLVCVKDGGSMTHCVRVMLQGVPVYRVIDSRADITILGGRLFKKVALAAKFRKKDFKKPNKTPRNI